jgi:hypothetical protein
MDNPQRVRSFQSGAVQGGQYLVHSLINRLPADIDHGRSFDMI